MCFLLFVWLYLWFSWIFFGEIFQNFYNTSFLARDRKTKGSYLKQTELIWHYYTIILIFKQVKPSSLSLLLGHGNNANNNFKVGVRVGGGGETTHLRCKGQSSFACQA